jgi:NAD-dependent deacetylase
MLVVGTSGEVYPAANLVRLAARKGARVVIVNLEPGPWDQLVDVAIHGRAADVIPQLVTPRTSATS